MCKNGQAFFGLVNIIYYGCHWLHLVNFGFHLICSEKLDRFIIWKYNLKNGLVFLVLSLLLVIDTFDLRLSISEEPLSAPVLLPRAARPFRASSFPP